MPYQLSFFAAPPDDADLDADVVVVTRNSPNQWLRSRYGKLQPRGLVVDVVSAFKERAFCTPMIGVQIRHGNGERGFRPPDLGWFHAQIADLRAANGGLGIFLATDSRSVLEQFQTRYPDVASTEKWYPEQGAGPLHQNPSCPDRFRNAVEALIDIWLLKECTSLVLSPGFFGRTARYLSWPTHRHARIYPDRTHPTREDKVDWDNPI